MPDPKVTMQCWCNVYYTVAPTVNYVLIMYTRNKLIKLKVVLSNSGSGIRSGSSSIGLEICC